MLQLYDVNKNKIKGLAAYKDYYIESTLKTGDKVLSFLYPKRLGKEIKNEGYIRNKTDEFVIKSIDNSGDWLSINANLNVENLEGKEWESFTILEQTIENCLTLACTGTGWTVVVTGVTKNRTIRMTNCNSWDIIQQARKTYLVEMSFDTINRKIIVKNTLGQDKGTYFTDDLNLKKLDINNDSYEFFTRIKPIGKNNLKINVNGRDYLENYQYSNKVKTLIWKDERYTTAESLKEDATIKLDELSKPRVSYAVDVIDLAKLNDKYNNILDYSIGDTIYLVSKENSVREKQRIVKMKEFPDEPERNSCEIANTVLTFEDIQKEYADTTDTVNNITSDNGTVSENAISTAVKNLTVDKVEMSKFTAVEGRVGSLEVNKLSVDVANIRFASIDEAILKKANITDLTATNIKFEVAEGGTLSLQTLLSKFVSGENGQFLNLTTDNVTISNALIKDVIAKSISVQDLKAGNIDANRFNIVGTNGNLLIKDNTIQIKDSTRVRVQIGKDASGDYSMYVWDKQGNVMFDALGLKSSAIKDKIIRDDMISDNANINGSKLNISSLITEVNKDNTQTLKASKIAFDSTGQSLEVSFNSLKSNLDSKESRNLLIGEKLVIQSGTVTKEKISNYHFKFTNTQVNNTHIMWNGNNGISINAKVGEYITVSFLIKSSFKTQCKIIGKSGIINIEAKTYNVVASEDLQKVVLTSKVLIDNPEVFIYFSDYRVFNEFGVLEIKDWKLEIGENSNPVWSIAPEDTNEKIESNTTSITAVQGKIEGLIKESSITKGDITTLKDNYTSIKATVDGINTTVASHTTSITNAQNTADSKAKVFISTPTTPYNIGDIWTGGPSGEIMKCKTARASGNYVSTDWEKASKYTDDTKANAVEGKVTEVETKQATLEQNLNGFKTTVSNTYSTKTELNTAKTDAINSANNSTDNKLKNYSTTTAMNTAISQSASDITSTVSNTYATKTELGKTTTRVESVENKVTATAITTTISSAINDGTSSISTTQFIMDKAGLTINNGALTLKNKANNTVLTADTDGNLLVQNSLTVGGNTNGNIQLKNASNVNIFSASKNGVIIKDGTMQVTTGTINWGSIGEYPEGVTKDMTVYAYGLNLSQREMYGSQEYIKRGEYFNNQMRLIEDNRGNADGTYHETKVTAKEMVTPRLYFNIDRAWAFKAIGTGGSTMLALKSETDSKTFFICDASETNGVRIKTSSAGTNLTVDGEVIIKSNNIIRHAFNANGTKIGGSMEIEGTVYGMSPTDSPQTLIEYIIPDVIVEGELKLELDHIYIKMVSYYVAFLSNKNIEIKEKGQDYITLVGNGATDILIKGQRKGADKYFRIMGGIEHGVTEEQAV